MIEVLVDHNIEGHAQMLWATLRSEGWFDLFPLRMTTLAEMGVSAESSDRDIWHFAQERQMILLTANRNRDDEDSLTQTIQDENTPTALPVLTIGRAERIVEREYRERCALRLLEVALDLASYLGAGRLFIR